MIQVKAANFSAVATTTSTIPYDDTVPQITEGAEFMTLSITPKSATNRLFIEAKGYLASSASIQDMTGALFQDATANAIAAGDMTISGPQYCVMLPIFHDMVAGTTSATTFRFRAGGSVAGTTTFNGSAGGRKFGGITLSTMRIIEYKP